MIRTRRRSLNPTKPKPISIIAQVEISGTPEICGSRSPAVTFTFVIPNDSVDKKPFELPGEEGKSIGFGDVRETGVSTIKANPRADHNEAFAPTATKFHVAGSQNSCHLIKSKGALSLKLGNRISTGVGPSPSPARPLQPIQPAVRTS